MICLGECLHLDVDYLPLIYKELLEIKTMYKSNQIENNKKFEEVKKVCDKLASTIEDDDPFSDGSHEIFNAQFPMENKLKIKSFQHELVEDPLMRNKLVNFAELLKFFF